jgi:hypothetical protein
MYTSKPEKPSKILRGSVRRTSHSAMNPFLEITFNFLEEKKHADIVSWDLNGKGIFIQDVKKFEDEVLPSLFGHNKFSSFVRQLHMYNFKKITSEGGQSVYVNSCFQRGKRELLQNVNRKKVKSKKFEESSVKFNESSEPEPSKMKLQASGDHSEEIRVLTYEVKKNQEMAGMLRDEIAMVREDYQRLFHEHNTMKDALARSEMTSDFILRRSVMLQKIRNEKISNTSTRFAPGIQSQIAVPNPIHRQNMLHNIHAYHALPNSLEQNLNAVQEHYDLSTDFFNSGFDC